MRRQLLFALASLLLLFGVGGAAWHFLSTPDTLRVAVGPFGSEDARLMATAGQHLARDRESLRFKLVLTEGAAASAQALDDGRADLAVVRTDAAMPVKAQSVAIMHRDAAVLVTPPRSGIRAVAGLSGRTVGLVRRVAANARLLDVLLHQSEVSRDAVTTVVLDTPEEVEAALRAGRIDAALAVGTLTGRTVADTVAAATAASDGASPVFLPVDADAIAQRLTVYGTFDIVRGVFGGAMPRPSETVKTLAVTTRLVAATSLRDSTVSELTRLLFAMRPSLAADVPLAARIEGADTAKDSSLPVHPGASAYYDDEIETFFQRYEDYLYFGLFAVSLLGSAVAGIASAAAGRRRARTLGLLERLHVIVRAAREADAQAALDVLEAEADHILGIALAAAGVGGLGDAGVSAFTLGLDQVRGAIRERREALLRHRPALLTAAE